MSEYQNFFEFICDDHGEAQRLDKKSQRMIALRRKIDSQNWSIDQAANECGVSATWVRLLLSGRIDLVEDLEEVCARVGVVICTR